MRNKTFLITTLLVIIMFLFVFIFSEQYILSSIGFIFIAFLILAIRFERKSIDVKELVLLAVLIAIAAIARVPFATIPGVQPTTFIIIISALVLGAESGLIIGAGAALVSNMWLGQGPWTPWQMLGWASIGYIAGILRHTYFMKKIWGQSIFGFLVGFLFGWIMNLWFLISSPEALNWHLLVTSIAASFTFDLYHAIANVFFIVAFSKIWYKVLRRYQQKYGLLA